MRKLISVYITCSCLFCFLTLTTGCSNSSDSTDDPSGKKPVSEKQPPGPSKAVVVPVNFDRDTRKLAGLINQLIAIHQQTANAGSIQALTSSSTRKMMEIEKLATRLNGAESPSESVTRSLKSGAVVELDEAIKRCRELTSQVIRITNTNGLSAGNLTVTTNLAGLVRKRLLASITPMQTQPTTKVEAPSTGKPENSARKKIPLWRSMVDPAPMDSLLESEATIALEIPGIRSQGPTKNMNDHQKFQASLVQAQQAGLLYSLPRGPVVRIGSNARPSDVSEVWNYITNQKLGTISKLALGDSKEFALSSDGRYFAAQPAHESFIGVWDVKEGKPLGTINIEDWSGLVFAAFGVENRLVIFDDKRLKIFTIPDGNPVSTSEPFSSFSGFKTATMTPGGTYVVLYEYQFHRSTLSFFNVISGKCDARIPYDHRGHCIGLAVSLAGDRLFLLTSHTKTELHTYDMKSGLLLSTVEIAIESEQSSKLSVHLNFYNGPDLVAFPDGRRLLLGGYHVIDSKSGELLQTLPVQMACWIRIVGENRLAVIHEKQLISWELPGNTDE